MMKQTMLAAILMAVTVVCPMRVEIIVLIALAIFKRLVLLDSILYLEMVSAMKKPTLLSATMMVVIAV